MKIAFIGKFENMHDEEYIARSFEMNGVEVIRFGPNVQGMQLHEKIISTKPDILLFTKIIFSPYLKATIKEGKKWGMKTVSWTFDLYWGYDREVLIKSSDFFKADYVFTTDGGHENEWKKAVINHLCIRQGIYSKECFMLPPREPQGIVFVGSNNPLFLERKEIMKKLRSDYEDFVWVGIHSGNQIRGSKLNELYAKKKIVVGDSVFSPNYWSNRVVETLGRGGFLIHRDVPGLKEEYPYLVTYDGTYDDLKKKIDYYMTHEEERLDIVTKNFNWVKEHYTMDKKCAELLSKL